MGREEAKALMKRDNSQKEKKIQTLNDRENDSINGADKFSDSK